MLYYIIDHLFEIRKKTLLDLGKSERVANHVIIHVIHTRDSHVTITWQSCDYKFISHKLTNFSKKGIIVMLPTWSRRAWTLFLNASCTSASDRRETLSCLIDAWTTSVFPWCGVCRYHVTDEWLRWSTRRVAGLVKMQSFERVMPESGRALPVSERALPESGRALLESGRALPESGIGLEEEKWMMADASQWTTEKHDQNYSSKLQILKIFFCYVHSRYDMNCAMAYYANAKWRRFL